MEQITINDPKCPFKKISPYMSDETPCVDEVRQFYEHLLN